MTLPAAPQTAPDDATTPAAAWVFIERESNDFLAVGPYPTRDAAQHAVQAAPLIEGLCEEDALDAFVAAVEPGAHWKRVMVDLSDPDHTGAPALVEQVPSVPMRGYGIPVVFDVAATDREAAAAVVHAALADAELLATSSGQMESWWFPEAEDRHAEDVPNDNLPMTLVPAVDALPGVRVSTYRGESDGVPVVQVDTDDNASRVRINVNDAPVWDASPEAGLSAEVAAAALSLAMLALNTLLHPQGTDEVGHAALDAGGEGALEALERLRSLYRS